jgi:hypothetical protein
MEDKHLYSLNTKHHEYNLVLLNRIKEYIKDGSLTAAVNTINTLIVLHEDDLLLYRDQHQQ